MPVLTTTRPPRTIFVSKVKDVADKPNGDKLFVLRTAANNGKVGKGGNTIVKGRYRGFRLFALTLEERATCPSSCLNWNSCYGNNSFQSVRFRHGETLESAIDADLETLSKRYPGGFAVRLHILGDFYSVDYVARWIEWFHKFPALHVFGYTHREHGTPIGDAVAVLVAAFPERCSILRSDADRPGDPLPKAMTVGANDEAAPGTIVCPEQTGKTESCLTCGLCMNGNFSVSFQTH